MIVRFGILATLAICLTVAVTTGADDQNRHAVTRSGGESPSSRSRSKFRTRRSRVKALTAGVLEYPVWGQSCAARSPGIRAPRPDANRPHTHAYPLAADVAVPARSCVTWSPVANIRIQGAWRSQTETALNCL